MKLQTTNYNTDINTVNCFTKRKIGIVVDVNINAVQDAVDAQFGQFIILTVLGK